MTSKARTGLADAVTPAGGLTRSRRWAGFVVAIVAVNVITLALMPLRARIGVQTVLLLFVLVCVLASAVGGIPPAIVSALAGGLVATLFFVQPYGSLHVSVQREIWDLLVFLAVAVGVGIIVELSARDRSRAVRASREVAAVSDLGRREYGTDTLARLLDDIREELTMDAVALETADGHVITSTGTITGPAGAAGAPIQTPPATVAPAAVRIPAGDDLELVLYGPERLGGDRHWLEALGTTAGRLWRTELLAAEASRAEKLARVDEMRAGLLAAVGHDLRTPLAAIKTAVSTLRQSDLALPDEDQAELLALIEADADKLSQLIANLLDMSRLQAGAMSVRCEAVAVEEVLTSALRRAGDRVVFDLPEDLPLAWADPGLLERVVDNLVDNAQRHLSPDGTVLIRGRAVADRILVQVIDHGSGVDVSRFETMFQAFQRFDDHSPTGVGLGLAIARGFVEGQGGTITPSQTPGGGLTMTIDLAVAR